MKFEKKPNAFVQSQFYKSLKKKLVDGLFTKREREFYRITRENRPFDMLFCKIIFRN